MLTSLIMYSCNKDDTNIDIEELHCTIVSDSLKIEPVCSFNPQSFKTVPFPVRVLHNGEVISHPEFEFDWSSDENFNSSAISITYEQLPLSVTVKEISNNCVSTTTLRSDYWD